MKSTVTFAQNREDLYLYSYLSDVDKGFYIDVGTHDPVKDSVTKFFYLKGWSGINIEPQKELFEKIQKDRRRDTNLNVGISDRAGKLKFRQYPGGGLSTFSNEIIAKYEDDQRMKKVKHKDYEVKVRTLKSIFENEVDGAAVHFLKIDVEGLEYEVIAGNDWQKYRPIMICVEANHVVKDWRPMLNKAKYTKVFFDGLNEYYLANEHSQRAEQFRYPELFLKEGPILPYEADRDLRILHKELNKAYRDVNAKYSQIQELQNTNYHLTEEVQALRKRNEELMHLTKSIRANLSNLKSSIFMRFKQDK